MLHTSGNRFDANTTLITHALSFLFSYFHGITIAITANMHISHIPVYYPRNITPVYTARNGIKCVIRNAHGKVTIRRLPFMETSSAYSLNEIKSNHLERSLIGIARRRQLVRRRNRF